VRLRRLRSPGDIAGASAARPLSALSVLMGGGWAVAGGRVDVAEGEERRNLVFEYNIAEDAIYGVAEGATSVRALPNYCINSHAPDQWL
jgi:hypothetical protein